MSGKRFARFSKKSVIFAIFLCLLGGVAAIVFNGRLAEEDLKKQTFARITEIRAQKKAEVVDYFANIHRQAESIATDQEMLSFFKILHEKKGTPAFELKIDKHYVSFYGNFYDILFIDKDGDIFHSVKKEKDYRKNIFTSEIADAKFAKYLKNPGEEGFVEYEYYPPSGEAAAFFTVLLREEGKHIGWFVLQCEIHNLNAILQDREGLGRTGEVYLVNRDKLMLSESRFMGDSTILHLRVDTVAVKEALQFGEGEKLLNDYRGVTVFSSYEKFDLFGTSWVILVEIDEDEIVTEFFKKHQDILLPQLEKYLAVQKRKSSSFREPEEGHIKRVDMNEFAKTSGKLSLSTRGVSTCTAISIAYPGKFAYLAHISPTDEIYLHGAFTRYFLRKNYHNFLSELISKIRYFDIYPYELSKLQFVIVANHSDSIAKALEIILAQDVELGSVRFLYNPDARSSNVLLASPDFVPQVQWKGDKQFYESAQSVENLGTIVKKIIHYDA